jgi:hypothetical protein
VPIFKSGFLFCLAPENFVIAVRVERRVNVNQIDAFLRQLPKLIEIVSAIDNAGIQQWRRFCRRRPAHRGQVYHFIIGVWRAKETQSDHVRSIEWQCPMEDGQPTTMKKKEKHRTKKEKHVVPVAFNLSAMLRVLTLAASADDLSANDKRDIFAVADQTDAVMEPHGGFHCEHPMIGHVDSARALVEGVLTWIDDFAKAKAHAHETDALLKAKAQKLIDAGKGIFKPKKKRSVRSGFASVHGT